MSASPASPSLASVQGPAVVTRDSVAEGESRDGRLRAEHPQVVLLGDITGKN